jgi:hypothetical protein
MSHLPAGPIMVMVVGAALAVYGLVDHIRRPRQPGDRVAALRALARLAAGVAADAAPLLLFTLCAIAPRRRRGRRR